MHEEDFSFSCSPTWLEQPYASIDQSTLMKLLAPAEKSRKGDNDRLSLVRCYEGPPRALRPTSPGIPMHIRHLEGLVRAIKIGGITKLLAFAARATNRAWARRKDTLRFYQSMVGWYALHAIQPSYHKLRTFQRVLSAQVHYVRWYKWPIWSSVALPTVDYIGHWERCVALQGLSYQPYRLSLVMVSSPLRTPSICFMMFLRHFSATTYVLHVKSKI